MTRLATVALAALALAPVGQASERHPTQDELESALMCPVCTVPLSQSDSPAATRMKTVIREQRAAGWTKSRIESYWVGQYGKSILAAPPKHGFDLVAWLLPLAGVAAGAVLLAAAAWRWSRGRGDPVVASAPSMNGRGRLDPELERRLDEELARFD